MGIRLYTLVGSDAARPFSPHVWKVVMALNHKGLDYSEVPTRFTEIPTIEDGAAKTVPVLNHEGRVVIDSFAIAAYLEDAFPAGASLFGGSGGKAAARLVESWSQTQLHPVISRIALLDIWTMLDPKDQAYFRPQREARFGTTLEAMADTRDEQVVLLRERLEPLRVTLRHQPFIGGTVPLFGDYILFGALQWLRVVSTLWPLEKDDPVSDWFERCLDLYQGLGRAVPARISAS